jgi:hypothetical protein
MGVSYNTNLEHVISINSVGTAMANDEWKYSILLAHNFASE